MKRIQSLTLLYLLIALPIGIAMADINVTWVRTGAVLETEYKQNVDLKINVATLSNGTAQALAETPTVQQLDANRVLLQFAWQPNQSCLLYTSDAADE